MENIKESFPPQETTYLELIGETIISPTKAGASMTKKDQCPFKYIDPDIKDLKKENALEPSEGGKAYVYRETNKGSLGEIFGSLKKEFDLLSFEKIKQIEDFVKNTPEILQPKECTTYFLCKNKNHKQVVVAVFRGTCGSFWMYLPKFSMKYVWVHDKKKYQFVVFSKACVETQS